MSGVLKWVPFDPRLMLLRRAIVTTLAVVASFVTLWLAGLPLAAGVSPAVLGAALTITFSRTVSSADARMDARAVRRARLVRFAAIPFVAVAATAVAWLFLNVFVVGAIVFVLGLSLAIWMRRFGPLVTGVGTVLSLPLMAVLVVPVRLPSTLSPWTAVVAGLVAAVVAVSWVEVLRGLARLTRFLPHGSVKAPSQRGAAADVPDSPEASPAPAASASSEGRASTPRRMPASTRMAVQLAAALTAAFVVGSLVFPEHWAWVVLTAFIVCAGNRGRGDVVYKSILRVAGAIAGTVAAIALTESITASHTDLSRADGTLVTVAVCAILFFGLWLRDVNYAFWAAAVTVILILVQGATAAGAGGSPLSTGVTLGERVVAIVVGALCGVLATWFVLPIRTEAVVRRRLADALSDLSTVVHPRSEPAQRSAALGRFSANLERLEEVARVVRVHRRFVSRRPGPTAHQADLIDAVAGLEPLLTDFVARMVEGEHPLSRGRLGALARAVGEARRTLASAARTDPETGAEAPRGTDAGVAAVAAVRAMLIDDLVQA